jgi:hypothetical protein
VSVNLWMEWSENTIDSLYKWYKTRRLEVIARHMSLICIVHTIVLFQSLAGMHCQTQHIEY